MKAAIFYGARDFRVEDIERPKIQPTDVLVKVKACGICGSDLHAYKEGIFSRPGFVMGHELAGEVIEVGKNVKSVYAGDYVSAESHIVCGNCIQCKTGLAHVCKTMKILGIDTDGCFAKYVSIPEENVWKNPRSILKP